MRIACYSVLIRHAILIGCSGYVVTCVVVVCRILQQFDPNIVAEAALKLAVPLAVAIEC